MNPVRVRPPRASDLPAWAALRAAPWPDADPELLAGEASGLSHAAHGGVFAAAARGGLVGLAGASLRHAHVNGAPGSPAGFLDGGYVVPDWRGRGVGRMRPGALDTWNRDPGCRGLACDARPDNAASHAAHRACGVGRAEQAGYVRKAVG